MVVHLPIGILILALVMAWLSRKEKYTSLQAALPLMFAIGALTAIISCITGYLLSESGEYDELILIRHKWLGIATALVSSLAYAFYKAAGDTRLYGISLISLFVLITITGHLGGSLTHGSGYLLTSAPVFLRQMFGDEPEPVKRKPLPDAQEAKAYEDLVAGIFQEKCISCHGPNKQKGQLRLDNPEMILKGGKSHKTLVAGSPDESELFKRIMYGLNDDDHMPPKEKSQLSKNDIALLHWWISEGNEFTKQVKELRQSDSIKIVLASYQSGAMGSVSTASAIPAEKVTPGNAKLIDSLRAMGITIIPVAEGNNYLTVSFLNASVNPDSMLAMLAGLRDQVIFLKLSGSKVSDSGMVAVAGLAKLTRLYLDKTRITDAGLSKLKILKRLQYLNLTGTAVTVKGVTELKGLNELQSVYLFQSGVQHNDWAILKEKFPGVILDSGGYKLISLASDTQTVKDPRAKKK